MKYVLSEPKFISNLTYIFCFDFTMMVRGEMKMDIKKEAFGRCSFMLFYLI